MLLWYPRFDQQRTLLLLTAYSHDSNSAIAVAVYFGLSAVGALTLRITALLLRLIVLLLEFTRPLCSISVHTDSLVDFACSIER